MNGRKNEALRRNGAAWIWAQIVGSDPYFSPALSADPERQDSLREVYRRFERRDLSRLQERLEKLAEELGAQL